jgi:hypothetical protein
MTTKLLLAVLSFGAAAQAAPAASDIPAAYSSPSLVPALAVGTTCAPKKRYCVRIPAGFSYILYCYCA